MQPSFHGVTGFWSIVEIMNQSSGEAKNVFFADLHSATDAEALQLGPADIRFFAEDQTGCRAFNGFGAREKHDINAQIDILFQVLFSCRIQN